MAGWIGQLKAHAAKAISDERMAMAKVAVIVVVVAVVVGVCLFGCLLLKVDCVRQELYPFQTPSNKEQMLYRDIFEEVQLANDKLSRCR